MSKRELARATLSVNGGAPIDVDDAMHAIHSKSLLDTLVSRIVALENEKAEIASAIHDIYVEAKGKRLFGAGAEDRGQAAAGKRGAAGQA